MTTPDGPQPPVPHAQPPRAPRQQLSATAWFFITAGATLALILLSFAVWTAWNAVGSSSRADSPRVDITDCQRSSEIGVRITYEITNRDDRARTVFVDFSVKDSSGTRMGTAVAVEPDIAPGEKVKGESVVIVPRGRSGGTCGVESVH